MDATNNHSLSTVPDLSRYTLEDLPEEITSEIARHLRERPKGDAPPKLTDLINLSKVSRKLSRSAQEALFREADLYEKPRQIIELTRTLLYKPSLGVKMQSLSLDLGRIASFGTLLHSVVGEAEAEHFRELLNKHIRSLRLPEGETREWIEFACRKYEVFSLVLLSLVPNVRRLWLDYVGHLPSLWQKILTLEESPLLRRVKAVILHPLIRRPDWHPESERSRLRAADLDHMDWRGDVGLVGSAAFLCLPALKELYMRDAYDIDVPPRVAELPGKSNVQYLALAGSFHPSRLGTMLRSINALEAMKIWFHEVRRWNIPTDPEEPVQVEDFQISDPCPDQSKIWDALGSQKDHLQMLKVTTDCRGRLQHQQNFRVWGMDIKSFEKLWYLKVRGHGLFAELPDRTPRLADLLPPSVKMLNLKSTCEGYEERNMYQELHGLASEMEALENLTFIEIRAKLSKTEQDELEGAFGKKGVRILF